MNSYLKSALAIILAFAFADMHAQIKPEYIFGVNLSTMTLKSKGISFDPEAAVGIRFGGFVDIPLQGNFTLQPGLMFSAKGSNFKIDSAEFSISPIYIEVPVIAVYTFGSDAVKISVFAGSYFACGIAGYKIDSGGELKDIRFGSGENYDLKPFDIGLNFGAGVNIKGFLISAQYGIGLLNLSPVATIDSETKNKVIGISISSLFVSK